MDLVAHVDQCRLTNRSIFIVFATRPSSLSDCSNMYFIWSNKSLGGQSQAPLDRWFCWESQKRTCQIGVRRKLAKQLGYGFYTENMFSVQGTVFPRLGRVSIGSFIQVSRCGLAVTVKGPLIAFWQHCSPTLKPAILGNQEKATQGWAPAVAILKTNSDPNIYYASIINCQHPAPRCADRRHIRYKWPALDELPVRREPLRLV